MCLGVPAKVVEIYDIDGVRMGRVVDQHPGMLVARTALGRRCVVDMQVGEQLPRIC